MKVKDVTTTESETLTNILAELGIERSSKEIHNLILWNDEVNSMDHIMRCLIEICNLNVEQSYDIMMEAHKNGKAIAFSGTLDELFEMKKTFNLNNVEVSIEK